MQNYNIILCYSLKKKRKGEKIMMIKTIDIYTESGDILVNKKKPEEILALLIENVNRDMRSYFHVSLENFQRFEEINDVQDWVNAYWENLHWHLSNSIKEFLKYNGYNISDLMVNAKEIFEELIEESREMFPDS